MIAHLYFNPIITYPKEMPKQEAEKIINWAKEKKLDVDDFADVSLGELTFIYKYRIQNSVDAAGEEFIDVGICGFPIGFEHYIYSEN